MDGGDSFQFESLTQPAQGWWVPKNDLKDKPGLWEGVQMEYFHDDK